MEQLVEFDGHLALTFGSRYLPDEPVLEKHFLVSDRKATEYPELIGHHLEQFGDAWVVWLPGRTQPVPVDTSSWKQVNVTERVHKPRRGRDYDWRWQDGGWCKFWR